MARKTDMKCGLFQVVLLAGACALTFPAGAALSAGTCFTDLADSKEITNEGMCTTDGKKIHGIISTGDSAEITNSNGATITTNNNGADGINAIGTGAMITNSNGATITTNGRFADGIEIGEDGRGTTIRNSGTITILSDNSNSKADGIDARGDTVMIINSESGTITTIGGTSHAINAIGSGVSIANSGTITTNGDSSVGIFSRGINAVITNIGNIKTTREAAHGIDAQGDDTRVTNSGSGTITTLMDGARGIFSRGINAVITNIGSIATNGASADGIFSIGDNAVITNRGSITANGGSNGIGSVGDSAVITNRGSGTITTLMDESTGVLSEGNNAVIINSGSITTNGASADGIGSVGDSAKITNSGSITTTGSKAHGIHWGSIGSSVEAGSENQDGTINIGDTANIGDTIGGTAENAEISNTGNIKTTGEAAHGIVAQGDGATITLSGSVSATGDDSYAVLGNDDNDQTLILLSGARIIGGINLGENTDDADILDISAYTGTSFTYDITGIEIFLSNEIFIRDRDETTDTVFVIDPTGQSTNRIALGAATGQIHQQIFQRQYTPSQDPMTENLVWGSAFVAKSTRNDDGFASAWDHSFFGAVGGLDTHLNSGQVVGLFAGASLGQVAGASQGQVKTSETTSINSAASVFLGVYAQQEIGNLTLDGAVILGYARHDSTRSVVDNINGDEIARAEYSSTYISPSLALKWSHKLDNGVELRPSAQISYTYGYYGDYTESGTTRSNMKFDDREVNIVDGRVQLAFAKPLADSLGEIEFRGGATLAHYGNDSVKASRLDGVGSTSYRVPGEETISGGYVGLNLRYNVADYVSVGGDIEFARRSGDAGLVSAQIGIAVQF